MESLGDRRAGVLLSVSFLVFSFLCLVFFMMMYHFSPERTVRMNGRSVVVVLLLLLLLLLRA